MNDVNGTWIPADQEDGNRDSFGVRALRAIGQTLCGLKGHHVLLHFEPNSISLECANCGWRSDGISVEARR